MNVTVDVFPSLFCSFVWLFSSTIHAFLYEYLRIIAFLDLQWKLPKMIQSILQPIDIDRMIELQPAMQKEYKRHDHQPYEITRLIEHI